MDNKELSICVVGLGYVGLPLALAFSKKVSSVLGFDTDLNKIKKLNKQYISDKIEFKINFTNNELDIKKCNFFIVAVPTPVDRWENPDLNYLNMACKIIGNQLSKNSTVVFESTVFPGTTEEICIPILEKSSGLKCGLDFNIGYSPERINPGDDKHTIANTTKIISGINRKTLNFIANVYSLIIPHDLLYKAKNIKTAEAAKIVENCQRVYYSIYILFDRTEL